MDIAFILTKLTLVIAAPIIQIILSICFLYGKTRLNLLWITIIAFISGVILPPAATVLAIASLPPGPNCITGEVAMAILGWMITAFFTPIIWLSFYILSRYRQRKRAFNN